MSGHCVGFCDCVFFGGYVVFIAVCVQETLIEVFLVMDLHSEAVNSFANPAIFLFKIGHSDWRDAG